MSGPLQAATRATHPSLISENASAFTPGALDGRVEAIAVDGDTVYVGGTFTQVQMALDGEIFNQPYLYAYSRSTGAVLTDFDPQLNNAVFALETTPDGVGIFAGGAFTQVNGVNNRKGLVKLDDSGERVSGFSARPNKRVYSLDRSGNTLYVGGNFERISGTSRDYLAAIDATTGALLPSLDLDFEGSFSTDTTVGYPKVDIVEVTEDGDVMVVVGNFRTIDGVSRSRLAVIELGGAQAVVSNWRTDVYDVNCPSRLRGQYINGMDIAPDGSYFVTGSTGYRRVGEPACDATVRFELDDLDNTNVQPTWVNYTGGDSVYEVAATEHAVYIGGHFRWLNNDRTSNGRTAGPGSVARRGFGALDPLNGLPLLEWRSDRNPRGVGVFALEVEPEGLYMGDDTDFLNGQYHPKFKFLPLSSSTIVRAEAPSLPTSVLAVDGSALESTGYNGSSFSGSSTISGTGWNNARGAMFLGGRLYFADSGDNMWVSEAAGDGTFAAAMPVDMLGLETVWNLSNITGMFFDYEFSRVYYTMSSDSRLLWRAFTPDNPIFGDTEYVADVQADIPWSDVRGMEIVNGMLYFGRSNGNLYRAAVDGASPVSGTTQTISGPGIDGRNWSSRFFTFLSDGSEFPPLSGSQYEFDAVGNAVNNSFRRFQFAAQPGQPINIRLTWDDPNAQLNVFLRDDNNQLVDSDSNATQDGVKWLSAPAGNGGTYTVAVKIREGSTAYNVSVNPSIEPPPPIADLIFSASGDAADDSWHVFRFDVEAGDQVDAEVLWDNPDADIRVFLRDENGVQVDRDTDQSGSPETVSAVAQNSGRWSIAVSIRSGVIDLFEVLVNFTEQ